jgi:hypothetical protein
MSEKINTIKLKEEVYGLIEDMHSWHFKRSYRDLDKELFVEEMKKKYEYLYTNSQTLFERTLQGDLNFEQFEYMLSMLNKVNDGNDYQKVSQEVGQKLVDIYVKPMLDKKDTEEDNKKRKRD